LLNPKTNIGGNKYKLLNHIISCSYHYRLRAHLFLSLIVNVSQCSTVVLNYTVVTATSYMKNGKIKGIRTPKPLNRLSQNLARVITLLIWSSKPKFKPIAPVGESRQIGWNITRMVFSFYMSVLIVGPKYRPTLAA